MATTTKDVIGALPDGTQAFVGGTPVMTADSLAKPQRQARVSPPVIPTPPDQFVKNLQPAIKQSQEGLIQAQTEEARQREDVLNRILDIKDPNSQSVYDNRFGQLGGNDYLKQFTDANTRLAQLQGVFNTGSQKVSSAPGQSQVFEGLQLNEVSRQKAVEVGNQALVVQALQGNIETARQIALDTTRFASEDRASKLESLINQFQALDGIVQGQEKQLIDNARIKAEQEYDQLKRMQTTIDTAIQSGGATVEEMQQLTRTDLSDENKMAIAQTIINRTVGDQRAFERKVQMKSDYGIVGTDEYGNNIYGFVNPFTQTVTAVNNDAIDNSYADGTKGGQCGEFSKNLCTLPTPNGRVGNEWAEKKSFVDKYGMQKEQVLAGDIQPGDVLYYDQSIGSRYGHVETVVGVNGSQVTVKGSNLDNNETVYTRTLDLNNMPDSFYGSIRGELKDQFTADVGNSKTDLQNALKSIAPRLTADGRKSASQTLNQYIQAGDTEGAKQFVLSTAISSLPAEQQNKAFGRLQAIDSLNNIKTLLAEYQSKGGQTDLLTGTQEQIAQKLGNTSDPELAGIGNQIALAMAAYRNAVSGAAFTESEAKFYENIFPSTKNIGTLNNAKIDSLISSFNLNQKTTLQTVLGAKNYDALIGGTTSGVQPSSTTAEDEYINSILGNQAPASQPTTNDSFLKKANNFMLSTNPLTFPTYNTYKYIKSLFTK